GLDALGATNADAGGTKGKAYGTMVADASEAYAMLESMGISQGGGAPPPVAPAHPAPGPLPVVLPRGNTGGFGGGPVEPALVTGGSAASMGATRTDAVPAAATPAAPSPLAMSQLGMPLPEARRDATIVFTPPSGTNT